MLFEVDIDVASRVAAPRGELDLATTDVLVRALAPLLASAGDLTIDMSQVSFVDSAGLHALLEFADQLGEARLRLLAPSRTLRRLIETTGVGARFDLEDPTDG